MDWPQASLLFLSQLLFTCPCWRLLELLIPSHFHSLLCCNKMLSASESSPSFASLQGCWASLEMWVHPSVDFLDGWCRFCVYHMFLWTSQGLLASVECVAHYESCVESCCGLGFNFPFLDVWYCLYSPLLPLLCICILHPKTIYIYI